MTGSNWRKLRVWVKLAVPRGWFIKTSDYNLGYRDALLATLKMIDRLQRVQAKKKGGSDDQG